MEYAKALALQEENRILRHQNKIPDTLFLLEHEPVYTIGRTTDKSSLEVRSELPHPVHEINRGGKATYHGPGQLVGYAIFDLTRRGRDLHRHLRFLEEALLLLTSSFGVHANRREGLTGIWVQNRKLASIGVGVRNWISMHGFGINVTPAVLRGFASIVPCGISSVQMTSLAGEAHREISMDDAVHSARAVFQHWYRASSIPDAKESVGGLKSAEQDAPAPAPGRSLPPA